MAAVVSSRNVDPEPFVKWAGGKQALALQLLARFPGQFERYFEPFLGGGALFFALRPSRAVLGDANAWLVQTYATLRDDCAAVIAALQRLPNTRADFLRIRAEELEPLAPAERAARFIYLNKTCFRGLFRVNAGGRFNVPYGAYQRRTHDPLVLNAVARALRGIELVASDFATTLAAAGPGDFVYLDPPYWKLGGWADFNRYTPGRFTAADHERLAAACRDLDARGVRFVLSNSDVDPVRALFRGWQIEPIAARREICLDSSRRDVQELVIRNF